MYLYRADALASSDSPNGSDQNGDEKGRDKLQLSLELVSAQRGELAALRKRGDLHEDAVRRIQTDLDLEEQRLQHGESQAAELVKNPLRPSPKFTTTSSPVARSEVRNERTVGGRGQRLVVPVLVTYMTVASIKMKVERFSKNFLSASGLSVSMTMFGGS